MLKIFPQCNFSKKFQKYSAVQININKYAIIDWVCLRFPKKCIVGYSFACHVKHWQAFYFNRTCDTYHHIPPSLIESDLAYLFQVLLALLVAKPEQEQRLLSGLVNKLGDPERKIAANVAHLLALLGEQQAMVYIVFLWNLDSEKLNLQIQIILIYESLKGWGKIGMNGVWNLWIFIRKLPNSSECLLPIRTFCWKSFITFLTILWWDINE